MVFKEKYANISKQAVFCVEKYFERVPVVRKGRSALKCSSVS
jgi:hypothetical protein